jgi:thiamine biosynthesis lipoprotein
MPPFGPEFLAAAEQVDVRAEGVAGNVYAFHDEAVLGTQLKLFLTATDGQAASAAAHRARAEIDRLAEVLDWRRPDSELARLNRSESHQASPELFEVIAAAEHWRTASNGAFSGRLGRVLNLWRDAKTAPPDRGRLEEIAAEADDASVGLDAATRTIWRPSAVSFDLDALAKGYIVDRAFEAATASPDVFGVLLDIGGDTRWGGFAPGGRHWRIGLPALSGEHDNLPVGGVVACRAGALAASGCGPRDGKIAGVRYSATLDPKTGWPVAHKRLAAAVADRAMDADALATIALNASPEVTAAALSLAPGAHARILDGGDEAWFSEQGRGPPPALWTPIQAKIPAAASGSKAWPASHSVFVTFNAPPRQMKRDRAFRSPYVAIWVTDADNNPVKTLVLIGSIKEWQQDNYIWWGQNRENTTRLVDTLSMSTRGTGQYKVLWDGIDDSGRKVAAGKYILHVETSRERGRHTHRSLELDVTSAKPFEAELPQNEESGGLQVSFQKY